MPLDTKSLSPAQEGEITRQLEYVSSLTFEEFRARALKSPAFRKWFKQQYGVAPILVLEKITEGMRASFMVAWEKTLRADAANKTEQAELGVRLAELEAAAAATVDEDDGEDDGEDIGPDLPLIRTRPTVPEDGEERLTEPAQWEEVDDGNIPPPVAPGKSDPEDPNVILLGEWVKKFGALPYAWQEEWQRTHLEQEAWAATPSKKSAWVRSVYLEPIDGADIPEHLAEFESYTESVRHLLAHGDNRLRARGLDAEEGEASYLVPRMIPAEGPTMFHGHRKSGKSSLAHKLAIAITCDVPFDGVTLPHGGRVLYVSADAGARRRDVAMRVKQICARLGVPMPTGDRLQVLDSPVNLTDAEEVAKFIADNPGPWALVVIDPFFRCVGDRDLAQATTATMAENGYTQIAEEFGAPVLIIHHDTKDGKASYGSTFIEAAGVAAVQFIRHSKPDAYRDGDRVTATVQWLKNDSTPADAFEYWIEGAYLATRAERGHAGESKGKPVAPPAPDERPDMLARLPTTARAVKGSIDLVADLMPARLSKGKGGGRETLWRRLREQWEAAGRIVQEHGTIRRVE
jgi:hypothetical protein